MRTPQRRLLPARQLSRLAGLLVALTALTGCEVSCENTCEKLLSCDEVATPLVSQTDCESACNTQEILYEGWDDQAKLQGLVDYKACVSDESCGDIADGACYDESIYSWSADDSDTSQTDTSANE